MNFIHQVINRIKNFNNDINNSINSKNDNNIDNNNNNNIVDNSILFFKIFRNNHLKKEIFNHIKLINTYDNYYIYGLDKLAQHEYKDYIGGLVIDNYEIIERGLIPKSIKKLSLSIILDQNRIIKQIPNHINTINILPNLDCKAGVLPSHIQHIEFHNNFKETIENGFLHNKLLSINSCNNNIDCIAYFPDSITSLNKINYKGNFDPPLQLRVLDGQFFNINQTKLLQLKHLKTVSYTSTSLYGSSPSFPDSVTNLTLYSVCIEPYSLPNSIKRLFLYDCIIKIGSIPPSVKTLVLKKSSLKENILSEGLTDLLYDPDYNGLPLKHALLPSSVISLRLGNNAFTQDTSVPFLDNSTNQCLLNDGLQVLEFSHKFNHRLVLNSLPNNITSITFGYYYNKEFTECSLPPNLKYLKLGADFNRSIKPLPKSIEYLEFGYSFNQPLYDEESNNDTDNDYGYLPNINLQTLIFGRSFNQKLPNKLPSSLTELEFGYSFTQQINQDSINHNNLKRLKLASKYDKNQLSFNLLNKLVN